MLAPHRPRRSRLARAAGVLAAGGLALLAAGCDQLDQAMIDRTGRTLDEEIRTANEHLLISPTANCRDMTFAQYEAATVAQGRDGFLPGLEAQGPFVYCGVDYQNLLNTIERRKHALRINVLNLDTAISRSRRQEGSLDSDRPTPEALRALLCPSEAFMSALHEDMQVYVSVISQYFNKRYRVACDPTLTSLTE